MNRDDLLANWRAAIDAGTFLKPKHHPSGVGTPESGYRSITVEDESGISDYLRDGDYTIYEYENHRQPSSPQYYAIAPADPAIVPGSGIPGGSDAPTHAHDRFVVVSGVKTGWHIFAESQANIDQREADGYLTPCGEVT